jgi:hypothetical protein
MNAISKTLLLSNAYIRLLMEMRLMASPALAILYRNQISTGPRPLDDYAKFDASEFGQPGDPLMYAEACIKRNIYAYIKMLDKVIRDRLTAISDNISRGAVSREDLRHILIVHPKVESVKLVDAVASMNTPTYNPKAVNDTIGSLCSMVCLDASLALQSNMRILSDNPDATASVLRFLDSVDYVLEAGGDAGYKARYLPLLRIVNALATLYNLRNAATADRKRELVAHNRSLQEMERGITDTVLAACPMPTPDMVTLLSEGDAPRISSSGYAYVRAVTSFTSVA